MPSWLASVRSWMAPKTPPPTPVASVAPLLALVPPKPPTSAEAFRRCLARVPDLAPREASVRAFVEWLRFHNEAGEWEQTELLEQYEVICELTRVEAMPGKWFGRALEANGCRRRQANMWIDGFRRRPWMVNVPTTPAKVAVIPNGDTDDIPWPELPKRARSGSSAHA